ncbi:NAD(P)/FAD-dependent oxidoreductase [Jatrophihabitans sp. YIM 134969]
MDDTMLDVLVVGGGSAGLSAAIGVARFGRRVEVVDAGEPRNAPAAGVHNLLGHDGVSPLELLRRGRAEFERFGGVVVHDRATSAARVDGGFVVTLASGARRTARRLVVATGGRDRLPAVEGLRERWGREVLHCPFCHGWEVRGETIGVVATDPVVAAHQALLFRELSDDVVVLAGDEVAFTEDQRAQFAALGIGVAAAADAVVVEDDRLTGVRLADGTTLARQALVVAPDVDVTDPVLEALGVEQSDDPRTGYVHDPVGATSVPGLWIAGNVAEPFATVVMVSAAGMTVASAVTADILAERVRRATAAAA